MTSATHPRVRLALNKSRKLVRVLRNRAYWPALAKGVAASVEHSGIPFEERFETVLDVGASRGQFALFSRESFPGTRIICFEPLPGPGADLRAILKDRVLNQPIKRPCLLKIDVQGYELNVLRGGTKTLHEVDVALIECSFVELYEGQALAGQVISFMAEAGFRLAGVHHMAYSFDGSSIQADFLFRREKRED